MASTKASLLASYVWGRLSDRSSRQTLVAASLLAAVVFALVGGVGQTFDGLAADRLGAALVLFGFAAIAALGALLARGLDEVQQG